MIQLIFILQEKVNRFLVKLKAKFYYRKLFKDFGENTLLFNPIKVIGPENIIIGRNVRILKNAWISAKPIIEKDDCLLEIGDGTSIGHFSHIYSTNEIIIEKKVLIADKVYISDNLHSYTDINTPIINQKLKQINSVRIGTGSWIGENVCILGSKIGKQCVIGANSVVTKDIPDYCVAAGNPAVIIKKYNIDNKIWEKINK